jgi:hypothetical protein
MVHQIKLKFCVCFIPTNLLQRYEMSKSKKLIASWFSKNRQLTLVLGFRGSCSSTYCMTQFCSMVVVVKCCFHSILRRNATRHADMKQCRYQSDTRSRYLWNKLRSIYTLSSLPSSPTCHAPIQSGVKNPNKKNYKYVFVCAHPYRFKGIFFCCLSISKCLATLFHMLYSGYCCGTLQLRASCFVACPSLTYLDPPRSCCCFIWQNGPPDRPAAFIHSLWAKGREKTNWTLPEEQWRRLSVWVMFEDAITDHIYNGAAQSGISVVIDRKHFRPSIRQKIIGRIFGRNEYSARAAENETRTE